MKITNVGDISYQTIKADLERCNKQLHALCAGTHDGTAVMSVPPQTTDYDMQFSAAFDELAAYRAIGTVDRLCELAEADNDGRCVVLPCNVGDILFVTCAMSIMETTVTIIQIRKKIIVVHTRNINKHGIANEHDFYDREFGKTVFLTRKAAENALNE